MNSKPIPPQRGKDWIITHTHYIRPKELRDFKFLKGLWVPTTEIGTHAPFACWYPLPGEGGVYVHQTKRRCQAVCSKFETPIQIDADYPLIAMLPLKIQKFYEVKK